MQPPLTRTRRLLAPLAVCGAAALALAACGDAGESPGRSGAGGSEEQGHIGAGDGTARVAYTSFPDYLDPALSYSVEGWQAMWNVYTPLLTYRHAEGADGSVLVPGLARDLPDVSQDGRTYRLRLRDGVEYSDGRPVRASDFEHTIKRVLYQESGGAPFYHVIEGVDDYLGSGRPDADIAGIDTDDRSGEIVIRLRRRDSSFANVLAMNFAGLVPGDTPFENRTKTPPPGAGALKLSDVRIGRGFRLERVPGFELDGLPQARLDAIEVEIVEDQRRQVRRVIANDLDYVLDPPPADLLRAVRAEHADRYEEFATNSTYFFFLNHAREPFDDVRVRRAVGHAIDGRALDRLFGGMLETGCNFLPPGMLGHRRIEDCPYGAPREAPDVATARRLVRRAGAEGASVTVWGHDEELSTAVARYLTGVLDDIGLRARTEIVAASEWRETIGDADTRAQAGWAEWFQDFPHPANFMFLVDPDNVKDVRNQNWSRVEDPLLGRLIDRADRSPQLAAVADLYARADRRVVDRAHVLPYGHRRLANFVSERVDFERCTVTHPLYLLDFALLCVE